MNNQDFSRILSLHRGPGRKYRSSTNQLSHLWQSAVNNLHQLPNVICDSSLHEQWRIDERRGF
jgi:hypothetical protein